MTSTRHNAYLDAARESILEVGLKRTTLTDVARRAGVSRMTIYRAWPDMQTLLADLMTREWAGLATADPAPEGDAPTPEQIAGEVVAAIRALRSNPLFRRVLDLDVELLLPYLFDRRGRSQQVIVAALAARITQGQEAGRVRQGDPEALARTVVLASHGLALSVQTMTEPDSPDASGLSETGLVATFADLLAGGLAP
ncbi:TetR/AcrR family transcriptional regulator [Aeromicrobium sp. CTD01-1L150]|uniref:TetR/AcrR family transcriptional regulator n=1 Tax=Aeromicrobium sp. CTD01-1L150 TaxID=3341830 RepID=UPI0035BFCE36